MTINSERKPRLIYCHFGDLSAIQVIMACLAAQSRNRKVSVANDHAASDLSKWDGSVWAGEDGIWPVTFIVMKPSPDESAFLAGLGFSPEARLLVCGDESNSARRGLLKMVRSNASNWALLRKGTLSTGGEAGALKAALQIIDSFIIHDYVHVRGPRRGPKRPGRRYFVDNPTLERATG